jgi:hypothetical protein
MKVIRDEETKPYTIVMEKLAVLILRESSKSLIDIQKVRKLELESAEGISEEVGMALGQVALDFMIEETKNFDREKLLRWFTEAALSTMVNTMNQHESFRKMIMLRMLTSR